TSSARRRVRSTASPKTNRRRSITCRVLNRRRADGICSQDGPIPKLRRLRQAIGRMVDEPQKVAKSKPGVGEKIIAAVGTAAAAALTKKMIERAWSGGPVFSRE